MLDTLVDLAVSVGFDASQAREALSDERYAYEVKQDLQEARQIGIRGFHFSCSIANMPFLAHSQRPLL